MCECQWPQMDGNAGSEGSLFEFELHVVGTISGKKPQTCAWCGYLILLTS